jgi:hypothetical protein
MANAATPLIILDISPPAWLENRPFAWPTHEADS